MYCRVCRQYVKRKSVVSAVFYITTVTNGDSFTEFKTLLYFDGPEVPFGGPVKRIEKQCESCVSLGTVLRTNAEENDLAGVGFNRNNRRAPVHQVFAAKPSGCVD